MWDARRSAQLRHELVKQLRAEQAIRSREIEDAFLVVPREYFLPGLPLDKVYEDEAIVVKRVDGEPRSSSSQPALMADMLEVLELASGQRVLEIGAGTGYNAALLARIIGRADRVVSVDLDAEMAARARTNLTRAGFAEVQVVHGDGAAGCSLRAPYDRIVVTVQQYDLSPAWVEQLQEHGILLVPLTVYEPLRMSLIPAFRKEGQRLVARTGSLGGFMPMQGAMAHPRVAEPSLALTPGPPEEGLVVMAGSPQVGAFFLPDRDGATARQRLRPVARERVPLPQSLQQRAGLALLLAMDLRERAFLLRSGHERYGFKGLAIGVVGPEGRAATVATGSELLHYGGTEAASDMRNLLERWQTQGRPSQRDFWVVAVPSMGGELPRAPGWTIERANYRFWIGLPESQTA